MHTDDSDRQCLHILQQTTRAWRDGGYAAHAIEKSIPRHGTGTVPIARIPTAPIVPFLSSRLGIRHRLPSNTRSRSSYGI
ncbi:uncharacterized protein EAF02_006272 [Botrytis sinoallii]|uniref:uncharacterized protein n=1 Tax=Botrytis sinoallii TaxID=1463999 RepID=UPI001900C0AF|nr:uncharacterized protein EAF02_006272 [Botrytis sinoallii]KAF7881584.1 hypothetical protein EAF02_006272 [Botrytis sinoallii]